MLSLKDDIKSVKGIGEKTALLLSKASVFCVNDLLHYFPRNYSYVPESCPISDLSESGNVIVTAKVVTAPRVYSSGGKSILSFDISDKSDIMHVYYFGMPYLKNNFKVGMEHIFYGSFSVSRKGKMLSQPSILKLDEYESIKGSLVPLYPLIKGLSAKLITKSVKSCLEALNEVKDFIPEDILEEYNLLGIKDAIYTMHFPESMDDVYKARRRLAFDEFLFFMMKLKHLKKGEVKESNKYKITQDNLADKFIAALPYKLTNSQRSSFNDIRKDLKSDYLMNRLLQGDVGSGKTIVAFLAALIMVENGYQVTLMAPTEVLATQHYEDIERIAEEYKLPFKACLLTGSVTLKNKRLLKEDITNGKYNVIIGTHALIQDDVSFQNLGLCICDEQHRFGVKQRLSLMNKGENVHVLVMSATPIPRTLGLILYGDLDISVINELPAERLPIKNSVVDKSYSSKINAFIQKRLEEGRQAYIICPMVEEGLEDNNLLDVTTCKNEISKELGAYNIEILHGKMKNADKNRIMQEFKEGKIDILISTTVVEVGVNVPNASVIVIENAERFGLAQLHQLRGRVGRGKYQSYCIFVSGTNSKKSMERLDIIGKSNDGFHIASEDLKSRGPGDFFGYKQSGIPMFKIGDIYTDSEVLKIAKEVCDKRQDYLMRKIRSDSLENPAFSFIDFHFICL